MWKLLDRLGSLVFVQQPAKEKNVFRLKLTLSPTLSVAKRSGKYVQRWFGYTGEEPDTRG